ncbi:hypothetical protein CPLU01_15746 [Colletotrichum plurivorum]|uniref:Helitron helicase-like domain-containing protein n=1 Tax=Colletotrichum plurivorum TaxID=2175906 RepID=A0A8H6J8C5_9PEZI|nr:hypothetical protein CPLU01_15746 [Colletotrichum plurivorum]
MKLTASLAANDKQEFDTLLDKFRRRIGRKDSIFGRVLSYFGCIETNERGALHIHGLMWLHGNAELPSLFQDLATDQSGQYARQVCEYIDSVFSECCDETSARYYNRWESIYSDISHLTHNPESLDAAYDSQVNWVASRCQMHSCGATCTKYSFQGRDGKASKQHPCRFKAPWPLRERTEVTSAGILHVKRNHSRINRFCPALTVALRHNTDVAFLPTNSAGLAMVYYATNYSTTLDTPLWKRAVLVKTVLENSVDVSATGQIQSGDDTAYPARSFETNNRARQFLARTANQIFSSRELSAVEGPLLAGICLYEYLSIVNARKAGRGTSTTGPRNIPFDSALPESSNWIQEVLPLEKHRIPVLNGYLSPDVNDTQDGYHQRYLSRTAHARSAVILLSLFVPWKEFMSRVDGDALAAWAELSAELPPRIATVVSNVQLLHKTTEDARRDARLWASRSEGDEGEEFNGVYDSPLLSNGWSPSGSDTREMFFDAVTNLKDGDTIATNSPSLTRLLQTLAQNGFSSNSSNPSDDVPSSLQGYRPPFSHPSISKQQAKVAKAAQMRLHTKIMLTIEGDEPEGYDLDSPGAAHTTANPTIKQAEVWLGMGDAASYKRVAAIVSANRTLNRIQDIALGLICKALDRINNDDNGLTAPQHLQYIGGGGGTGKSWLIDSLGQVFVALRLPHQLVVTATSGTAAAGIASADDFLQGFLERLRSGTQTPDDASKLAARFTPGSKFDFSLDYNNATGKRLSIFLSDHQWKSRMPSTTERTERTAAVLLGDEGKLPVPGMFPFVEGMPVLVNVNKYMGLKVVNGSEYEAAGIILEPGVEEVVLSDHLSLFLGPPAGILLRSADTQHLSIPHIPEGTVLLPATTVTLEDKHAKILCPELAGHKAFKLDITRTGLPCTPGVALTDFKAQGRSIDHPLLGLYGRGKGRGRGSTLDKCDAISVSSGVILAHVLTRDAPTGHSTARSGYTTVSAPHPSPERERPPRGEQHDISSRAEVRKDPQLIEDVGTNCIKPR